MLPSVVFGAGWTLGWLLLWSGRRLPAGDADRGPIAVVVPARDEEHALAFLLGPLLDQLRPDDELVVVDDHSTDATATVAIELGAVVVRPPSLPAGWVGKPHACWHGALSTTAETLLFVDADVRPGPHLLDGIAAAVATAPGAVVSVQPWHDAPSLGERVSSLPNVLALMGTGGFTVLGQRVRTDLAFGAVLAVAREDYARIGGHAAPAVRASLTEDIELARLVGRSELFTSRDDATFRMYTGGSRQAFAGWARTLASGVAATRWWIALAAVAWVSSLAGGPFASWWTYPLSAVQVAVLSWRAGRFGALVGALYPLAVLALLIVVVGAVVNRVRRRTTWKGREIKATSS